jgi:hypothetical protein
MLKATRVPTLNQETVKGGTSFACMVGMFGINISLSTGLIDGTQRGFRSIFWLTVGTETGLCVTLLVAKYSMFNGKLSYRDR